MSDLISRQAAIDAIRASTSKYTGFMEMEMYTDDDAVEAIEGLPSAQPEIIRCKDCKHNPKITWFGCPLAHCSETQRPETAWCWKAERREEMSDLISRQAAIDEEGDKWN